MLAIVLTLAATVLVALLLGVHLTGAFLLNPALRMLDTGDYIRAKQAVDRTAPRLAKPLMLTCLVVTTLALGTVVLEGAVVAVIGCAIALVALVATLLAILRGDVPINRRMADWSPSDPPANWLSVRDEWERFFTLRSVANLVALIALVVACSVSIASGS